MWDKLSPLSFPDRKTIKYVELNCSDKNNGFMWEIHLKDRLHINILKSFNKIFYYYYYDIFKYFLIPTKF